MGPLSPHIAGHIALYGSRLLHGQEDLWQGNRKAGQWSDRNHWQKPDQFPRFVVVSTSLLHSRAYQYSTAKVYVFSDSALCYIVWDAKGHDELCANNSQTTKERSERLQNAKYWILRLNADGPEKHLRQRPKFVDASKRCLKMQDAHLAETQQSLIPIRPQHQQRQRLNQQFEGGENFDFFVDRKTGCRYCREPPGNPLAASSSSTSQWPTSQWQNELELMAAYII